jgi:hypothetical protein
VLSSEISIRILERALLMRWEGYGSPPIRGAVKPLKAAGRQSNNLKLEGLKRSLARANYSENRYYKIL